MTDEQLKAMSKADANASLSRSDMHRWVQLHNATANLYFVKDGKNRRHRAGRLVVLKSSMFNGINHELNEL